MRKTFLIAIAALVVLGTGGYFGFRTVVGHVAEGRVEALFGALRDSGVEAQHGAVSYDLFEGRFEISDVSFAAPGQGRLAIGSLLATGLERTSPFRIFARRIEVHDVAFDGPLPLAPEVNASYRAPRIDLAVFEAPSELPASGSGPWPVALAFLDGVTVDRIDIPAATAHTRSGEGATRVETDANHGPITVERFAGGKIARLGVETTSFQVGGSPAVAAQGQMGPLTAEAVDLMPVLVLLDPERRQRETAFRTVYGLIRAENYRFTADNGTAQSWAKMEVRDVALQPSTVPAEDLIAAGERLRALAAQGRQPAPHEVASLLTSLAGSYDALRIGGARFEGIEGKQPDGSALTVKAIALDKLDAGRLDRFAIEALAGREADGKPFKLDRLALGGLRPGAALRLVAQAAVDPALARDPAGLVALLGLFASLDVSGAEAPVPGTSEPARIDTLSLAWDAREGAVPTRLTAKLRASGPTAGMPATGLSLLLPDGVSRASLSVDLGAQWKPAEKAVIVEPVYAEMSDSFALHAKARLGHVEAAAFSADPAVALAAGEAANIEMVQLTLTDSGLYDQKLAEAAREQNVPPQMLRQLLAGFSEMLLNPLTEGRPDLDPAVQALVAFLQKPMGTLSLRLTPRAAPVPLMATVEALRNDPTSLIDRVKIEVVGNP